MCGFVSQGLPEEVRRATTFEELRENLVLYAQLREEAEGKGRTHYRTLLSFEVKTPGTVAAGMVREWLNTTLPGTRAIGFVHQNTDYTHAHVWIDARQTNGRKLDLSPREFRTLDEAWNLIYCREFGRNERDHLEKKERARERYQANAQHHRTFSQDRAERESPRAQRSFSAQMERRAREDYPGERAPTPGERICLEAITAYDQALRETEKLHRDAAELDRKQHTERDADRGRE